MVLPSINHILLNTYNWCNSLNSVSVPKSSNPIRFGVLGAADFSPIGLFDPARSHPDVEVVAIAARSKSKAEKQAKKYGIPRAYEGYESLLKDENVEVVYIPLPIGVHAECLPFPFVNLDRKTEEQDRAIKAMKAGKHVLIEKVMCSNEAEAKAIQQTANETGKIAMEAFHWQFHPASHVTKALIDSGRYGKLLSMDTELMLYKGMFAADDIRFQYATGGGACMDLAYIFSVTRYFTGGDGQYEVVTAKPRLNPKESRVDDAMEADINFYPSGDKNTTPIKCHIHGDLAVPKLFGVLPTTGMPVAKFELEHATITFSNFTCPQYGHSIVIKDRITGVTSTQKHYSFGPKWKARSENWWGTYRYQLEAFVMKIKGEQPPHWVDLEESVKLAALIDQVYEKAGMVPRGMEAK